MEINLRNDTEIDTIFFTYKWIKEGLWAKHLHHLVRSYWSHSRRHLPWPPADGNLSITLLLSMMSEVYDITHEDFGQFLNVLNQHNPTIKLKSTACSTVVDFLHPTTFKWDRFDASQNLDTKGFFCLFVFLKRQIFQENTFSRDCWSHNYSQDLFSPQGLPSEGLPGHQDVVFLSLSSRGVWYIEWGRREAEKLHKK